MEAVQEPLEEVKVSEKGKKLKCYRRTQYPTMDAAKAEAVKFIQFEAIPYECRWCKEFHVIFT